MNMTTPETNALLATLSANPQAAQAPAAPINDVFSGVGAAFQSKKSRQLPVGKHVFRIESVKLHTGNTGTFYIVEVALLRTNVEGLDLGSGYAFLMDPMKKLKFQPWIKGLIRAILGLDFSAASEAKLLAEADAIARASTTHGVFNGKVCGVENVAAKTKPNPKGEIFDYVRQNWFPATETA